MCWACSKVGDSDNSDNKCYRSLSIPVGQALFRYKTKSNNLVKTLAFQVKIDLPLGPNFGSATF